MINFIAFMHALQTWKDELHPKIGVKGLPQIALLFLEWHPLLMLD